MINRRQALALEVTAIVCVAILVALIVWLVA